MEIPIPKPGGKKKVKGKEYMRRCLPPDIFFLVGDAEFAILTSFTFGIKLKSSCYKKKIDKSINFLRGGEKKIVSIFCLQRCEKVELSWDLNKAGPEIDT